MISSVYLTKSLMQNLVISINAEIYYEVETLKYKNIILERQTDILFKN